MNSGLGAGFIIIEVEAVNIIIGVSERMLGIYVDGEETEKTLGNSNLQIVEQGEECAEMVAMVRATGVAGCSVNFHLHSSNQASLDVRGTVKSGLWRV